MLFIIVYSITSLILLSMALGWYKPKKWNEFTDKKVKTLKVVTFIGSIGMGFNAVVHIIKL